MVYRAEMGDPPSEDDMSLRSRKSVAKMEKEMDAAKAKAKAKAAAEARAKAAAKAKAKAKSSKVYVAEMGDPPSEDDMSARSSKKGSNDSFTVEKPVGKKCGGIMKKASGGVVNKSSSKSVMPRGMTLMKKKKACKMY